MKKLSISIIAICFLIACGGGGYGSNENPNNPTPYQGLQGIVPEQVDPVQKDVFTDIGSKPEITLPSVGSEEASVVHGVTVITP